MTASHLNTGAELTLETVSIIFT